MKIVDKVAIIAQLKERIAEARMRNDAAADQLQKLLDSVLSGPKNSPAV